VSKEIVIAHYNEPLEWIKDIPEGWRIVVYFKGKKPEPVEGVLYRELENVGRESHTYLYHIIANYDKLCDITVFTQADPFDHNIKFLEELKYVKEDISFRRLSRRGLLHDEALYPHLAGDKYPEFFRETMGYDCDAMNFCFANAIFAVNKDVVQGRHLDFYRDLFTRLPQTLMPFQGHFIERMWARIFRVVEKPTDKQMVAISRLLHEMENES
jgi:hypothetical protein